MVLVLHKSKAMGECITLGYSREPPVATFFGRRQRLDEYREVVWYMPKRLPCYGGCQATEGVES